MNVSNAKPIIPAPGTAIAKAEPKPERTLIDSLTSCSALEISRALPEKAFSPLMSLQKSLTQQTAATASTVRQVIAVSGQKTTNKLICAVLKLYNDGLNTTLQMTSNQLFEYAIIWADTFPNETVKDLILCLKRVKSGQYGKDYNRVDGSVISNFFREYLADKAQWLEDQARQQKGDGLQRDKDQTLIKSLPPDQQTALAELIKKPERRIALSPDMASLSGYIDWLRVNVIHLSGDDLTAIEIKGNQQKLSEVLDIVALERDRRNSLTDF